MCKKQYRSEEERRIQLKHCQHPRLKGKYQVQNKVTNVKEKNNNNNVREETITIPSIQGTAEPIQRAVSKQHKHVNQM